MKHGGPIGLLLGYSIVGSITYAVMISLGEMVAYLPISGGHIALAKRFVDPAFSFTMVSLILYVSWPSHPNLHRFFQGWNYWYNWVIILPAELSAAAVLINYWNQTGKSTRRLFFS